MKNVQRNNFRIWAENHCNYLTKNFGKTMMKIHISYGCRVRCRIIRTTREK